MEKGAENKDDPVKNCIVADFQNFNHTIKRPGVPLEGSSQLLRRMDPDHRYYGVMDMSSGYHQIEIPEGDQDLFVIILPQGKYRYTRVPHGTSGSMALDIFLTVTDKGIRNRRS